MKKFVYLIFLPNEIYTSEKNAKEPLNYARNGTYTFWPNISSLLSVAHLSLPSANHPALSLLPFSDI